jgi:lipoprotein-releasing system permease protein
LYRSFLAVRYLKSRLVNLISIGGVMAGVAVLIVVVSVMDGFQEKVRQVLRGTLSHLIMTPMGERVRPFAELDLELRHADERIVATAPEVSVYVGYPYQTKSRSAFRAQGRAWQMITAVGIDWEREKKVSDVESYLKLCRDRSRPFYSARAADRERKTVWVSKAFAKEFFGRGEDECEPLLDTDVTFFTFVEDEKQGVQQNSYNLVITGIYDAEDQSSDARRIFMDKDQLREIARIGDEYQEVRIRLRDYEEAPAAKKHLQGAYPDTFVETWEDRRKDYLRAVNTEKVLLVIVLSFIVLLGGFIILATLTLTVVEKTRDIGILAALGAGRRGILGIFLTNGFLIGLLGSALGVGLGLLFTANINNVKDGLDEIGVRVFPPDIYLFKEIPTVLDVAAVLWIVAGSTAVAFLAGLLPALRAARLDPVVALRHE